MTNPCVYLLHSTINRNIAINMGITKTAIYTDKQNEIASVAKVLGHPARIAILEHLLKVKSCICGDLVQEIGLAQATISQHLREMKQIGLIKGSIEGTSVCYCINPDTWKQVQAIFDDFLIDLDPDTDQCC
jgi:ArsR family transcriptional regulator, arsenate/arsenite/antimonite-responsive transcriptional repressor